MSKSEYATSRARIGKWRVRTFVPDWLDFPEDVRKITAWSTGDRWNGWGCPYLTKKEADRFVAMMMECGFLCKYEEDRDTFSFYDTENNQWESFAGVTVEELGAHLYPIGVYSWTWWVADPELDVGESA